MDGWMHWSGGLVSPNHQDTCKVQDLNHMERKINPLEALFSWRKGESGDSKAQADLTSLIMFTRTIRVSTEGRLLCAMHCPLEV